MVHEVAAAGFNDPADYEAARPSYPPDAVSWVVDHLRIGPGARVCRSRGRYRQADTAARADRRVPAGGRARGRDARNVSRAATGGSRRCGDCRSSTVRVRVTRRDHRRAGLALVRPRTAPPRNARRVINPGGGLGLVWNARDRSEPWVDDVWSIMDRVEKHAPWRDHENWRDSALGAMPGFGPVQPAVFHHRQQTTREGMMRRMASVSHVAVLPAAARAEVLDEVRVILDTHPSLQGQEVLSNSLSR